MIQAPAASITADPLPGNPFQSGSTNRYAYALNNPIAYEDVSGLSARAFLDSYMQGWTNFSTAWSILQKAEVGSFAWNYALAYVIAWGGAHLLLVLGLSMLAYAAVVAAMEALGISVFASGGAEWHLGLEFVGKMNIIHIGNSIKYGIHLAFGAVAPKVADLHIYLQEAFPFFRIWRP